MHAVPGWFLTRSVGLRPGAGLAAQHRLVWAQGNDGHAAAPQNATIIRPDLKWWVNKKCASSRKNFRVRFRWPGPITLEYRQVRDNSP